MLMAFKRSLWPHRPRRHETTVARPHQSEPAGIGDAICDHLVHAGTDEVEAKTAGWSAGNEALGKSVAVRLGVTRLMGR
jgi:hypothetical protein